VFLSGVSADKKQPKQVGKMPEIRKNFNFQLMTSFSWKILRKISVQFTNFQV